MTGGLDELKEADDVFERFVATLSEHDISQVNAGALTLQLFGGVERTRKGRPVRGNIHVGFVAGAHTNVPGLVSHLVELAPNAASVNASNSTYTGLTGPVRSLGPNKGWYLDEGVLTDSTNGYIAIQSPDALDDKSVNCLKEAVGSGGVTISKKGFHETISTNASILLIGYPKYGDWDEYEPLRDQLTTIDSFLASGLDSVFADITGREERPEISHVEPDVALEYIKHAQETCSPTLPNHAENELFEGLVEIHVEKMDKDSVPQSERETVRRLAEASARTRLADTVSIEDAQRAITIYRRPFEDIYGIDYEPPSFDEDPFPGINTEEKRKRRMVKQFLADESHLSTEELVERSREEGLSEEEVRHIIGYLDGRGDIMQNYSDKWYHY
jgi:replicative DNA helicase Mcm